MTPEEIAAKVFHCVNSDGTYLEFMDAKATLIIAAALREARNAALEEADAALCKSWHGIVAKHNLQPVSLLDVHASGLEFPTLAFTSAVGIASHRELQGTARTSSGLWRLEAGLR